MTKKDFVNTISARTGFTKTNAAIAFDAFVQTLAKHLSEAEVDDTTPIPGVGKFITYEKPARVMHDFDGNPVNLPPKKSIRFLLSPKLKKQFKAEANQ